MLLEAQVFKDERGAVFAEHTTGALCVDAGQWIREVVRTTPRYQKNGLEGIALQLRSARQWSRFRKAEIFDAAVELRARSQTFGEMGGIFTRSAGRTAGWRGFARLRA